MSRVQQEFYAEVVNGLLESGVMHTGMSILVVCGHKTDRAVMLKCGFRDVVISNIDERAKPEMFAPYRWSYQNAEELSYEDESFDFVVVHSGLHHCYSPHRALLEMYRVARQGLLLFEPYDNLVTRVGVRLNLGQEYEHASLFSNKLGHGGAGNTSIPNYVYRFTDKEIVKAINTYAPHAKHQFQFIHKMRIPWGQLKKRRNKAAYHLVRLGQPALKVIEWVAPKQSNCFAAVVRKPQLPDALHPWLRQEDGEIRLNDEWVAARFAS